MSSSERLLAVDDDPDVLKMIEQAGKELGFTVLCISRSGAFKEAYRDFVPTIITVDLFMPDVDGLELLLWLADSGFMGRIIVISGSDGPYLRMMQTLGSRQGAMKLSQLAKPFRVGALRTALLG